MPHIDLNCDMGEGAGNDAALMPLISSANIACGYHAGDDATLLETVQLAVDYGVSIGAHVSYPDKENFGRTEMNLAENEIYKLVQAQIERLKKFTDYHAIPIRHVKPHGALYNMSARDEALASIIAKAVFDFDPSLTLLGLSGSHSISAASAAGLKTASEVFADRRYEDNGALRSRSLPGAMLEDPEEVSQQVMQMITTKTVTAFSGRPVPVKADTICIHGDGPNATGFTRQIHHLLKKYSIDIKAL